MSNYNSEYPYSFGVFMGRWDIKVCGETVAEGDAPNGMDTVAAWLNFASAKILTKYWCGYERPAGGVDPLGPHDKVTGGVFFVFRLV
jgi:hypothetical protein